MTEAQFATVNVGDVLLAMNGRHMHITALDRTTGKLDYYWEADISSLGDRAGEDYDTHYRDFAYASHISKGTTYGTHRTLRHQADFKAKP